MARSNYNFKKRQKELARKKKQEEKRKRKQGKDITTEKETIDQVREENEGR